MVRAHPAAYPRWVHERECGIVRSAARIRARIALIAGVLAIGWSAMAAGVGVSGAAAASPAPRVVIVVGPSGAATDRYRAQARDAAAVARRFTTDVTELYSPNATWPAVRAALQGASVVIYLGHGNGWPSPHRRAPFPATQNGFGLNPQAGGNDTDHQYFGEAAVGSQIRLAPDAVVLLHHLCYASGLSEPGVPEGELDVARQRVDNFAAGFIRAGASAVIADAYAGPTTYLASILGGRRPIASTWRHSTNANGHAFAFESLRSPGFIAQMDPEGLTSGFTRSIVLRAGLTPADVRAGARGSSSSQGGLGGSVVPSLIGTGIHLKTPTLAARPAAGATVRLDLPFLLPKAKALPDGIEASVRWDAIELLVPPATPPTTGTSPTPGTGPTLGALVPGEPDEDAPHPLQPPSPPDGVDLVVAEGPGDVVAPTAMIVSAGRLSLPIVLPVMPGRYRLTVTLHDAGGVAFDTATQALLPPVHVRVANDVDGAILVAPVMTLTAGSTVDLPIRVANLGARTWGIQAVPDPTGGAYGRPATAATAATIVGWWLPGGQALTATTLTPAIGPGRTTDARIALIVPRTSGIYTLVLDLVTPEGVSLMAAGMGPTLVRITVVEPR